MTLRAAAVSLETSSYDSFAEFEKRLGFVLKAAEGTIDSDFFTRVGLRYINAMPCAPSEVKQWVNPALVSPLGEGTFGDVEEYGQRVRGPTTVGGYYFQHGLGIDPQAGRPAYILDFDFYREDVTIPETLSIVRQLHDQEYAMFAWSLGDKAKQHLGPSTLKK